MSTVIARKFGEETFQFIGKKVSVETSDEQFITGYCPLIDDKLDIVLNNVEGQGILKIILNGSFVKKIKLLEKPFDFKALSDRILESISWSVKIRDDVGAIIVMDKIKVTQAGIEEGSGLGSRQSKGNL